jgi:glycine/D-amino acid oxidase-like deaminating enzyme
MATRRELLKMTLAVPALAAAGSLTGLAQPASRSVVVVGAGAFGGWTALDLRRRGARVTLVDAWGPGNARASSGGETRVIRATYGTRAIYSRLALRAMELWDAFDTSTRRGFFRRTGALWMFGDDDAFGRASAEVLRDLHRPIEEMTPRAAAARWPQISFDGIRSVLWEPEAGYLFARRACEHVVERFIAEGGTYRQAGVRTPVPIDAPLGAIVLEDGTRLEADAFVFACGPWLPKLFPDVIGANVTPTRQEVYYFGPAAGDTRFVDPAMPVWVDYRDRLIYGIPGNANRGFKVADDTPGPAIDPTTMTRDATPEGIRAARDFLRTRFPALADAPLLGSEVCQYEASPDSHYIIDRHPAAPNAWIVGGGSGHGFKMGPAIGELVATAVLGGAAPDPQFALARLAKRPAAGWEEKWS